MRVVMLGPPASGKGTQARKLAARYGVPHLSTGALLRAEVEAGSPIGRAVEATLSRGELVDDDTVIALLARHVGDASNGWVLDGFPRTVSQARALDAAVEGTLSAVVALEVSEQDLVRRVRGRARREGRDDDSADTLRRRLAIYERETRPLLDHYAAQGLLHRVDGGRPPGAVTRAISDVLAGLGPSVVRPPARG